MSFGGFGNNNNNASSGFGGFGNSNTGGGFGASNNTSTGGSLFGGNTATSGGFGGFGSSTNNANPFGASKPAFGAATTTAGGGGLFGSNTSTSGSFGGFGSTTNNNTSAFGSNTGGGKQRNSTPELAPGKLAKRKVSDVVATGLFGQNKPATTGFGANTTGSSLFGGGNTNAGSFGASTNTGGAFGSNANTGGFGSSTSTNTNTGGGFSFGGANSAATNSNNGTSGTPFNAFQEKDVQAGQMQHYQSITFQQPYQNKSFEELRVEDYAQGRRFGNTNGQAGSFGQSTGFGGFGASNNASTGGGLFGSTTATSGNSGFGGGGGFGSANTGGGFGSNTAAAGSLFGQNKPAPGGLFGNTATSGATTGGFGSTSAGGSGLFGSGGGFGTSNNTNTNTATGNLFGGNNNATPNKPAFGGFGGNNTASTGFGGGTNTAGGGLFGGSTNQNTGGGLFGQNNQQQQQQQQQSNPFGAASNNNQSGGLFGNQNKPAQTGLFGSSNTNTTNTGGGLFGGQPNQQQSGGLFGSSANNAGSNSLFGNQNQNKPAGTGLFGSTSNTGGSLFGNQNNQQSGSSLFGNNNANNGSSLFGNQNKPATTGLFGNSVNTSNTGGGLFGNNQNQQGNTSSLFGGSQNQNTNQNTSSLFGGSLSAGNQQQQQQNQLHASLTGSPYGNEQLFSSLAAPSPPVGPLATPLNGAKPAARKTPSLLSSVRMSTPVHSPRGGSIGRAGGYGFSYSTYGTPGSAFTTGSLTPGAGSLLRPTGSLGSALTSRLSKSFSTSNLRGDTTPIDGRSLLRPSPFSPDGTPGRYNSGSMRKLKIDRSLRTDLFGAPAEPKAIEPANDAETPNPGKRVSFDNSKGKENSVPEPNASNALVRTEDHDEQDPQPASRAPPITRSQTNGRAPEMEQVDKSTLQSVPEDAETPRPSSAPGTKMPAEKSSRRSEAGDYWTRPAMKDLKKMSRQQLKNIGNFTVGRDGVGRIEFGSVDLTNTPLEDICGNIVQLNPRSATVYQDDHDKPSMGKALNVPSTIYLENSWPRAHGGKKPVNAKSGREYDKHIARLKRVGGTHFVNYSPETGVWSFKVDHFTTYGLDDDTEDESELPDDSRMQVQSSGLTERPESAVHEQGDGAGGVESPTRDMDDTFQFQLEKRSQLSLPGGFDPGFGSHNFDDLEDAMDEDQSMGSDGSAEEMEDPFTSPGGAVRAPSPGALERYHSSMIEEENDEIADLDNSMPGTFAPEPVMPRSILKPSTDMSLFGAPQKLATDTWEEQLQRTISPKKRDRQALRDLQQGIPHPRDEENLESPLKQSMLGHSALGQSYLAQKSAKGAKKVKAAEKADLGKSQAFRTAMDLMNSLYGQEKKLGKEKGFEV